MDIATQDVFLRLLVSLLIGLAIGIEREVTHKPAGLRTCVLICVGATIYTIASLQFNSNAMFADSARVAAGIVTGIGFLGAGAIIQTRASVHGLTTAATIWVLAALGLAVGIGAFDLAVGGAILSLIVLVPLQGFERAIKGKKSTYVFDVLTDESGPVMDRIMKAVAESAGETKHVKIMTHQKHQKIRFHYTAQDSSHTKLLDEIRKTPGVIEVSAVLESQG